jgi:hypothetical protein
MHGVDHGGAGGQQPRPGLAKRDHGCGTSALHHDAHGGLWTIVFDDKLVATVAAWAVAR